MKDGTTELIKLPRLSDEALALFFAQGGFGTSKPIDLRPMLSRQREHGPAVTEAAERWCIPPDMIVV